VNKKEFKKAFALAQDVSQHLDADLSIFEGSAYSSFEPVYVTIKSVAALLRYQALQFNGQWDLQAVNDVAAIAKKRFRVLDSIVAKATLERMTGQEQIRVPREGEKVDEAIADIMAECGAGCHTCLLEGDCEVVMRKAKKLPPGARVDDGKTRR
jgi:hypothetical protein